MKISHTKKFFIILSCVLILVAGKVMITITRQGELADGESMWKIQIRDDTITRIDDITNTSIVDAPAAQQPKTTPQPSPPRKIPVFYNVFVDSDDVPLAHSIVKDQMAKLRPVHEVFVRSIGNELIEIENTTLLAHDAAGNEVGTLAYLWRHCQNHTTDKVVYLHSKGSFHPSPQNDKLRKFLTRGALSEECETSPSTCDVCSSRMSPLPHAHTSGNMWLAKCEYVAKLIDPLEFGNHMGRAYNVGPEINNPCIGLGRFAAEHWIHSHPSARNCDLSTDAYTWDYKGVPDEDFEMNLMPAPRYERKEYFNHLCNESIAAGARAETRLREYEALYNETVSELWWGWKFFNYSRGEAR